MKMRGNLGLGQTNPVGVGHVWQRLLDPGLTPIVLTLSLSISPRGSYDSIAPLDKPRRFDLSAPVLFAQHNCAIHGAAMPYQL
ncbi:hypothetical protein NMY22_g13831 [Coprinellus aureogranulatus]|nr:hypothetical protein NMY22_g13831 [Coprinellus aureogranulatus]